MLDSWTKAYYDEYRAKGYTCKRALHAARIKNRFTDLEAEDLVRLHAEPEIALYDDPYIDTWDHLSDQGKERAKKELWSTINREGCWIWCAQYRARDTDEWEYGDNIGGIIGDDLCDYEVDLMQSAIEEYDKALQAEADAIACRATYAGMSP